MAQIGQTRYELLHECIAQVKVVDADGLLGTGFFVAPGLLLTCAHVVALAQGHPLELVWQTQKLTVVEIRQAPHPTADLALLRVALTQHPCVLLQGEAEPSNNLYSYGYSAYSAIYLQGASSTFQSEG